MAVWHDILEKGVLTMTETYILVGIIAVVCGIIIACLIHKKRKASRTSVSPQTPAPARSQADAQRVPPALPNRRRDRNVTAMPARRSQTQTVRIRPAAARGPHGVRPDQFPWCPVCGKHNEAGAEQVVFWMPDEKIYKCAGGHKMAGNGRMIF